MLFLYHNLSLLPKSGNKSLPCPVSLHPRNIEPSKELVPDLFFGLLGVALQGVVISTSGVQAPPLCKWYLSLAAGISLLHCPALLPASASFLPLDYPLVLGLSQISACPVDRLGDFAAPYCFCLHKWLFPDFPLGHVSGWHGLFFLFSFPVFLGRDGVWLSCRTGKVGGSSLGPVGLEARLPLSSTVPFFLSHCLGWGVAASVWKCLFLRSLGLGLPQSGDEAMTI